MENWTGFESLKKNDQEKLRSKVTPVDPNNGNRFFAVFVIVFITICVAASSVSSNVVKVYTKDCSAEYSPSSRAACKWCKEAISKSELR